MAIINCKMCGGDIEVSVGMTICECPYCDTDQTVPNQRDQDYVNMFNRANKLRLKSEFDKAYAQYETIVLKCPDDPESYWGLLLSRFGVEYVKDPGTDRMIPTLHRTQKESVLADPEYQSAMEYADDKQRGVYEREASQIDRLQKEVMAVVQNESPYDVFISYKQADENGSQTKDSLIANDIYDQLTKEGLKVFYAAVTLDEKPGEKFEPYIYSALHSAKVMLVIGTKPEYFEAVWVRNEWSRYLKIVQSDQSKLLLPCYCDMDPIDLPAELSYMPAQDMSRIGFISDVLRMIRKSLGISSSAAKRKPAVRKNGVNIDNLLRRGDIALDSCEWDEAVYHFDRVLEADPGEYRAYIGKLCAEVEVSGEEVLVVIGKPIMDSENYKKACLYGGKEVEDRLYSYVTNYDPEYSKYKNAVWALNVADTIDEAKKLAEIFRSLGDYKDAAARAEECEKKIAECTKQNWEDYLIEIKDSWMGDTITLGGYNWLVIDRIGDIITLLCCVIVDEKYYNIVCKKMTWEKCELRQWLNGEFYDRFSDEEKRLIVKTNVDNPRNPTYSSKGGNPTEDYVYLLSAQEARRLDQEDLDIGSRWWTRTPGIREDYVVYVNDYDGKIDIDGAEIGMFSKGVRPVINIKV